MPSDHSITDIEALDELNNYEINFDDEKLKDGNGNAPQKGGVLETAYEYLAGYFTLDRKHFEEDMFHEELKDDLASIMHLRKIDYSFSSFADFAPHSHFSGYFPNYCENWGWKTDKKFFKDANKFPTRSNLQQFLSPAIQTASNSSGGFLINSMGDGNCFFRAVSTFICGAESLHIKLRLECCKEILGHPARYNEYGSNEFIDRAKTDLGKTFHTGHDGWANSSSFSAMANVLDTPVFIYHPNPGLCTTWLPHQWQGPLKISKCIFIHWYCAAMNHFCALALQGGEIDVVALPRLSAEQLHKRCERTRMQALLYTTELNEYKYK